MHIYTTTMATATTITKIIIQIKCGAANVAVCSLCRQRVVGSVGVSVSRGRGREGKRIVRAPASLAVAVHDRLPTYPYVCTYVHMYVLLFQLQ